MNIQDVIAKLKAAQDAINQFKQQVDSLVASVDAPPTAAPVTGDSPTEKVPAVVLPPAPQTFSGEHSA